MEKSTENRGNVKSEKVKRELIGKGYVLELLVYEQLSNHKWEVELNPNYWDVETDPTKKPWAVLENDILSYDHRKKIRTIDLIAEKEVVSKSKSYKSSKIVLVIECKHRSNDNWAFHFEPFRLDPEIIERWGAEGGTPGTRGSISLFSSTMMEEMYTTKKPFSLDEIPMTVRKQINWVSHHSIANLEYVAGTGVTLFSKSDSLRNSVQQVLDASVYKRAWEEHFIFGRLARRRDLSLLDRHWRIYPLIVFDGPIWSFRLDKNDLVVEPHNWVTYAARRKDCEYYVDIVSWSSFDSYLDHLDDELTRIEEIQ